MSDIPNSVMNEAVMLVYEQLHQVVKDDVKSYGRMTAAEVQAARKLIERLNEDWRRRNSESLYTAAIREDRYGRTQGSGRGGDDQAEV